MVSVTPLNPRYVHGWRQLWRRSVGDAFDKEAVDHTERHLLGGPGDLFGLVAVSADDEVIGLLHGVVHPVAGSVRPVCYMQDLFVHPSRRRQGVATALLDALAAKGRAEKWDRIYWLTDRSNSEAQALYKNAAVTLDFSFHIVPLGMLDKLGVAS